MINRGRDADGQADEADLSLRDTAFADGPELGTLDTQLRAPELGTMDTQLPAPELGALDTQIRAQGIGTLETISPFGATMASGAPPLPSPAIDRFEGDRIKGSIMAELFGARPEAIRIGRFSVLGRLGEGGMGTVYAAYDEQLDRKVAVKVLRGELVGRDPGARLRLVREAQAMARLAHPNLITVHEAGEHDGQVFVAMEFVRGQSLDAWLRERPGWRAVVDVFLAAGAGIAAAHAAGIIHRDLKPHNIMRGDDGTVKVLDFGLARAVGDGEARPGAAETTALVDARLTRTGAIMGTPAYMSPEQHVGDPVDARSDQFSFAAALYEGLYAQLPIAGDTMLELVQNARAGKVRPPPADAQVPGWVHRVVLRGLARDPADRFESMEALLAALARDPVRRRRRALAIAGFAAVMAGGGFGAASLAGGGGPAPCSGAGDEIAAVWGDARRESIAAAFAAADPLGAATWQQLAPRLDAHADAWAAMRGEACEAHQAGRQSAALLDLRMACLDRRLAGLDALARVFAGADAEVVLSAVTAVDGLAPITGCGDLDALTAPVPLPEAPRVRERVRAQERALEGVAAHQLTGHYKEALAELEAIDRVAREVEHAPLVAEVALARGRALQELAEGRDADEALTDALVVGLRARAEAVAAEAAARRIYVGSELLADPRGALRGAPIADALVDRAGDPPQLRWLWANNVAAALDTVGDFSASTAHFLRASEVASAHGLVGLAAITDFNLSLALVARGDMKAAAPRFAAVADELARHLGATHPQALKARILSAQTSHELGRIDHTRELLARTVEPLSARLGADAPDVQMARLLGAELDLTERRHAAALATASALAPAAAGPGPAAEAERLLGAALLGLGRRDEALLHARQAIERAGDDADWRIVQLAYLGDTLRDAGALDEALARHREALEGAVAGLGDDAPEVAIVRTHLARTHLARGELDEAHAAITRARATFDAKQPESPYLARVHATLGAIERARGDLTAAEAALRAAAAGLAGFDDDHPERNAVRFALAQVLAERSGPGAVPAEARTLAREAHAAYVALGEGFAAEAAAIVTWLSGHQG